MKTITETQAYEALRLAQIHAERTTKPLKTSAASCVQDAERCFNAGDFACTLSRARESLRYSIGVFHPDFAKV